MRIVFATHAPWRASGYGVPSIPVARMWREMGHEVMILAIDSHGPGIMRYEGFPVALMDREQFGLDIVRDVCQWFQADLVVSIFDPWVLGPFGYAEEVSGVPWAAWVPVDQIPLPYNLLETLQSARLVLPYSCYGARTLTAEDPELGKRCMAMPIPVDVEHFTPGAADERAAARQAFNLPGDAIVAGMVSSNLPGDRKALAEQIQGFAFFADSMGHDKVRLILDVEPNGTVEIPRLVREMGIADCVGILSDFSRRYALSDHRSLVQLYRAMDVLLHASAAEGFGMCLVEAMACGVPVIYNPVTSMPEIVEDLGFRVAYQTTTWSIHGGWWQRPTPEGVAYALDEFKRRREAGTLPGPERLRESMVRRFSQAALRTAWETAFRMLEGDHAG